MNPFLPIGVMDSGVGGLTVARRLADMAPGESIIYFADSARFPYGPRILEEVRGFTFEILDFLQDQGVKLGLIACNTASAAALEAVRDHYPFPVIGVIDPGADSAVAATKNGRVGVLATRATIGSGAYQEAIKRRMPGVQVFGEACPKFVLMVEAGDFGSPEALAVARDYLLPMIERGVDTLVLGCTHFPPLVPLIRSVAGESVALVDPAWETARLAIEVLGRAGGLSPREVGERIFYTSGDPEAFRRMSPLFWPGANHDVRHKEWDRETDRETAPRERETSGRDEKLPK
ncbi:MAG: glutamate racemase [Actinobacteria bacterium]|nr:glutamate racemase [Actinomycetota bacterium]